MLKRIQPASDSLLKVQTGLSRAGQPLSYNRAPCADLAPWIGRLYARIVDLPDNYCLASGLFNDVSMIRLQMSGEWRAMTADGPRTNGPAALLLGPHSRLMPISVTGGFVSVGISLRPGTGFALRGIDCSSMVDRVLLCDQLGLDGTGALNALVPDAEPEEWLQVLEQRFRVVVEASGGAEPDPITRAFEALAFDNPQANIADFARDMDISQRQLERIISRDFGLAPKQVMRRARALDMAAHLRGVADEAEAEQLALRYYDQSQMTRDFTYLFGMSPRRFMATPQAILTLGLEARQAKRLEAMDRLQPGDLRPWQ